MFCKTKPKLLQFVDTPFNATYSAHGWAPVRFEGYSSIVVSVDGYKKVYVEVNGTSKTKWSSVSGANVRGIDSEVTPRSVFSTTRLVDPVPEKTRSFIRQSP